jgi:hypothetical protein
LQPLGIPEYPWETVGIDYVTDLPQSGIDGYTTFLLWFVTLLKWLTLFHVTRRSLRNSQQIFLLIIVIVYMVSLELLYRTKILSLLESAGKPLWKKVNT